MDTRRVVITGMGALTPIGNSVPEFWRNAIMGKSGAAPIQSFDTSLFKTKIACELKGFDPKNYLSKKEQKKYDPYTQYALVAVREAVESSAINFEALAVDRIGVIWGSCFGGIQTLEQQLKEYYQEGEERPFFSPYFIPKTLIDIAAGVISIHYGLQGVNYAPISACATSTTAIIDAFNYVRWNKADMILAGGSEASINPSIIGGFSSLKALSKQNDNYQTASRPFDRERDGFVMGEGAGAVVVEELKHAQRRGAPIIAEIVGGGMAADAHHLTSTHPEGRGAGKGMKLALEEAKIDPKEVDYINLHATSTPNGDISELRGVHTVFGERGNLAVSGTKSMTGHLLGAAGAIETILCAKALQEQIVLPTINVQNMEPEFKEAYHFPLQKGEDAKLKYALNNTFGFGGHIASLLLKRWEGK